MSADHGPSVLFPGPPPGEGSRTAALVTDLGLDRVFAAVVAGREEYDLLPFCFTPLDDLDAIAYRHEVFRDLDDAALREQHIGSFAEGMREVRRRLRQRDELRNDNQRMRWHLDAVTTYVDSVLRLAEALAGDDLRSCALRAIRDHALAYVGSDAFRALAAETRVRQDDLARIRYQVRVHGSRVTVDRAADLPDLRLAVNGTFARFRDGAVKDHRVALREPAEMDHVEANILDRVALLFPDLFGPLREYCARHADFVDPTIRRFDREIQLLLAYRELVTRLGGNRLAFSLPQLSDRSRETEVRDAFDLALAIKLAEGTVPVVTNDLSLHGPERILVISGPNSGGKTTYARTVGQLHYLAKLGVPVPGREARLFLCDAVYTHFEREERLQDLRGKLKDDLLRVHAILEQATDRSVVILNESFASTTLADARFLGREVVRRLIERGLLAVYVTFIDELSRLGPETVSMVSTVPAGDPATRTFKIVRRAADGRAYALAIAERYGLRYETLRRRVTG